MKKQKLRLKLWVKIAICLFLIECCFILNGVIYNNMVAECTEAGFTEEYCKVSLIR